VTNSVRARFAIVGIATVLIVIGAIGMAVQGMFERHNEREVLAELDADLRFLARSLVLDNGVATLSVQPLADPRFQEPLSGLYWQVRNDRTGGILRSPSLAGASFPLEHDRLPLGERHRHIVFGPEGTKLIVLERRIEDPSEPAASYRVAVAVDRKLLEAANRAFLLDLLPLLGLIGAGMLLAFTLQGGLALGPIARARRALQELAEGKREGIGGALPSELQALANRFDALLDEQRRGARLARERTADLAHGLRTALALLNARIRELRDRGDDEMAQALEAISTSIEQRMARELARAYIEGPKARGAPLALRLVIERVARAFARTSRGETLTWQQDIPQDVTAEIEEGDFVELLGVLLDNATKWASGRIGIGLHLAQGVVRLSVEDDGPGIPPQDRRAALTRGVQLNSDKSGTGLGLAMARDIALAYGGEVELADSALGGLRVEVVLPLRRT
jgi:signal transduction histidine kinase